MYELQLLIEITKKNELIYIQYIFYKIKLVMQLKI